MTLTAPAAEGGPANLFRDAAESASGLKDIIDGLAQSGNFTMESLTNAGVLLKNTFDQAKAGGGTSKEALQAMLPALQAQIDAAAAYGLQLDSNTQALVDQAKAEGLSFKTDPMVQMVDILKAIAEALGATIPESAQTAASSLSSTADAGTAAATTTTQSFNDMSLAITGTTATATAFYTDAVTAATTDTVNMTQSAMDAMVGATDTGWALVGGIATETMSAIARQAMELGNGITVPINFTTSDMPPNPNSSTSTDSTPGYASGGTVNAPESGAQVTVHGTEHILRPEQLQDYMAAAMKKAGSSGTNGAPIVVQLTLDGNKLAQQVVDMRRRGSRI
jgi:hypothetical protein